MKHIEAFDRWTKHAGTDSELESLHYVEAEMRSYGYRTEMISHPAYISLPGKARVRVAGRDVPCITHSFSRATGDDGCTAELVYVGRGTARDFADHDVAGRIVLVDGVAMPGVARLASAHGAVGQLHVSPHEYLHEMCISPVWGSPDDRRKDELPRTVACTISQEEGELAKRHLANGERVAATLWAEVDTGWRATPILVADMAGPDAEPAGPGAGARTDVAFPAEEEPFVFFTGHHDTWYYGVMDNGGANATMLEVARLCAEHRRDWRRGLRVVYWSGHSQGRYSSSAWYADHHWDELERRALVHVNVDSTGGRGNTDVSHTSSSAELRDLAERALQEEAGQPFAGQRMARAGDQSFWGIGVPAIFGNMSSQPESAEAQAMPHSTGWWWHNPADTGDKMDADILVRDTAIYQHVVSSLLTAAVLPLDFAAYADEALDTFEVHRERLGERFDMTLLIQLATRFKAMAVAFREGLDAVGDDAAEAARANECLRRLSRVLVPVAYTEGDRYGHDPAVGQPAFPALADLARLAELAPDSDAFRFLENRLVRARNRVAAAFREAIAVLNEYGIRVS